MANQPDTLAPQPSTCHLLFQYNSEIKYRKKVGDAGVTGTVPLFRVFYSTLTRCAMRDNSDQGFDRPFKTEPAPGLSKLSDVPEWKKADFSVN